MCKQWSTPPQINNETKILLGVCLNFDDTCSEFITACNASTVCSSFLDGSVSDTNEIDTSTQDWITIVDTGRCYDCCAEGTPLDNKGLLHVLAVSRIGREDCVAPKWTETNTENRILPTITNSENCPDRHFNTEPIRQNRIFLSKRGSIIFTVLKFRWRFDLKFRSSVRESHPHRQRSR